MSPIDVSEYMARVQDGEKLKLLDVRSELEYSTFNIGGQNLPLSRLPASLDDLDYNKTDEIIVVCKVGLRSKTATDILIANGYQNARNLQGGLVALKKIEY
jgi:rhodanese-related sulfurtransferase